MALVAGAWMAWAAVACGAQSTPAAGPAPTPAAGTMPSPSPAAGRAVFGGAAAGAVRHKDGGAGEAERDPAVSVPRRGERRRRVAYSVRGAGEAERGSAGA